MAENNTWPGWECTQQLGAGSFGKVYEIRREEFGKTYKAALKVITVPQSQADVQDAYSEGMNEQSVTEYFRSFVENITGEFALMSELKGHSNIVSYEDHMVIEHKDDIGWDILIRMELLVPLQKWATVNPMTETTVIKLGCDICRALELCQKKKIIHRDIKPENIFVNSNGDYKLGDFGIARTVERTVSNLSQKGTFTYMAPEVYQGHQYGMAADIYSLGMVLYRYLNGNRAPFFPQGEIRFSDREEALAKRMSGQALPLPQNGSTQLKNVVLKALAYNPKERFGSPAEFRQTLEKCLESNNEDDKTLHLFADNNIKMKYGANAKQDEGTKTEILRDDEINSSVTKQARGTANKNAFLKIMMIIVGGLVFLALLVPILWKQLSIPAEEKNNESVMSEGASGTENVTSGIENIRIETDNYPAISYTIDGVEKRIEYRQYEGMFPEYEMNTETGDITGDGIKDLMVSIYMVGNTLHDYWQDTYIYQMDPSTNDLREILDIPNDGCEKYLADYPNNIGAYIAQDGTVELHVATTKNNASFEEEVVYLKYSNGNWNVLVPATVETEKDETELEGDVSLLCQTDMLLVGDSIELNVRVGSFYLEKESSGLTWNSDNEAIATVKDGVVTGVSEGIVNLTGAYNGREDTIQLAIVQLDEKSNAAVKADYEKISIGYGASENIELTLSGDMPEQLGAICYSSSGLDIAVEWGALENDKLPVKLTSLVTTTAEEGYVTILFYPQSEPTRIVAVTTVHIRVNY